MNKKYFLLIIAAAGAFLVLYYTSVVNKPQVVSELISPTPEVELQSAMVVIDQGDGNPVSNSVVIDENSTAFSLLKSTTDKEKIELITEQYDFGVFVKSISGTESTAQKAWIYFVNGKSGTIAADQIKVNPGDTVEWRYIKPE